MYEISGYVYLPDRVCRFATDPAPVFSVRPPDKMMDEATDESCDSFDEQCDRPAERWAPLGAANVSPPCTGEIRYIVWLATSVSVCGRVVVGVPCT